MKPDEGNFDRYSFPDSRPLYVIFHGDDFGLTSGVNKGILQAFRKGVLTSVSIMACGAAVDEAIEIAHGHPDMDTGVHLVLSDEIPLRTPTPFPFARFPRRRRLISTLLSRKLTLQHIETQWKHQVEMLLDAGIPLSHMDSHQHIHLYPGILPIAVRIAIEYGIPFIRSSFTEPVISAGAGYRRMVDYLLIKSWSTVCTLQTGIHSWACIPTTGFLHAGGKLNFNTLSATMDAVRRKRIPAIELMLHPGTENPQTCTRYHHWNYFWENDLNLITDPRTAPMLAQKNIIPASFARIHEMQVHAGKKASAGPHRPRA